MPVWSGSFTDWRATMPGALISTLRNSLALMSPFAVDRHAERVHDAAEERLADRNLHDLVRALDGGAFLDLGVVAENRDTDALFFEVEHHAGDAAAEVDQLAGHGLLEAVNLGDAVTDGDDRAGFGDVELLLEVGELGL